MGQPSGAPLGREGVWEGGGDGEAPPRALAPSCPPQKPADGNKGIPDSPRLTYGFIHSKYH